VKGGDRRNIFPAWSARLALHFTTFYIHKQHYKEKKRNIFQLVGRQAKREREGKTHINFILFPAIKTQRAVRVHLYEPPEECQTAEVLRQQKIMNVEVICK